jgi:hypothetical protein
MLFMRIKRTEPEKVYVVAMNSYSTASLTNGQPVDWDYVTDCDGVSVTKPATSVGGKAGCIAGIVAETIAAGDYGLIQVYGHHTAIRVRTATGGAVAGAAGVCLVAPASAAFQLDTVRVTGTFARGQTVGILGAAQASYTTKAVKGFIRCL